MAKKLSEGQKMAIRAIKLASARLVADVKNNAWVEHSEDFQALFHLKCNRYDTGWFKGDDGCRHPAQASITLFQPVWAKVQKA